MGLSGSDHEDITDEPQVGCPEDKILLLSFPRPSFTGAGICLFTTSPFAGKVEMMLRMAGLEYKGFIGNVADSRQAPKRKVRLRHVTLASLN